MSTILILGASSDIAQAIAATFANQKFNICLAGRDIAELHRIQKDLQIKYSVLVTSKYFDAQDLQTHQSIVDSFDTLPEVTACVFGYLGEQKSAEQNPAEAMAIMQVNYVGAVSVLSAIANKYEAKNSGTIIGISSVAGERGRQSNYFYGSAKAGFSVFLDGLRNRLFAANVHVVTVKPGFVNTKMTQGLPLPKPLTAQPTQVADAVFKAYLNKRNTVYVLWMWRWIMLIIKCIPEFMFKKMKL